MIIEQPERERRRALAQAHLAALNAHDLDAIMTSFSPHATRQVNDTVATTSEAIAAHHRQLGLSAQPDLLSDLAVVHEREHFTDQDIVYEGYLLGKHTGLMPGYPPPSGQSVKLRCVVVYRFDEEDLLVSESARVDFSPILFAALGIVVPAP